jgi:hypothetical protein|tara:strand:- start:434 stop:799 length:366 start_codon:yes stop_codon:yes gene_type:complete
MSLDKELERCRPWIEAALKLSGGTHIFDDIAECVKLGTMQFWNADKSCAVTEILQYPRKKVLHIFLAGGDKDQIIDMNRSAEEFGKRNGCTAMSLAGRRGWVRSLKTQGWQEMFTAVGKEI